MPFTPERRPTMRVLVAYASRHGATKGIAERIAAVLERRGLEVDAYDAFVVGSAAYMGRWLEPARAFVTLHRDLLAAHPLWLFSSGPIGTETVDAKGRDVVALSEPSEFRGYATELHPREMRVF